MLGIFIFKNAFANDNCSPAEINFNNQIYKIFQNIKSLENCIKPASKYRLKSCVKRKQEGSKGINCFPELSKALNSNNKNPESMDFPAFVDLIAFPELGRP